MRYILNDDYMLCGWIDYECTLLERKQHYVHRLSSKEFKFLLCCDGQYEFSNKQRDYFDEQIKFFLDNKIICKYQEGSLKRELEIYKRYDNHYVKCVQWSVTGLCNYNCKHCYLDAPSIGKEEISDEETISFVHQMAACGIQRLKITGGEPLVRRNLWDIIDECNKYNIFIDEIFTNGKCADRSFFEKLKERNMKPMINISFDGVGHHDWLRGVRGAEEAALQAFNLCREYSIISRAEMCLHDGNKNSLRETVNILAAHGVSQLKIAPIIDTDLWEVNCTNKLPMEDYFNTCIDYLEDYFRDGMPLDIIMGYIFKYNKEKQQGTILREFEITESQGKVKNICDSARDYLYIAPNGQVLPCMVAYSLKENIRNRFPNLRDIPFQDILKESYYYDFVDRKVDDLLARNNECNECSYKYKCRGGCRIQAMMQHDGDEWAVDRINCLYFQSSIVKLIKEKVTRLGIRLH